MFRPRVCHMCQIPAGTQGETRLLLEGADSTLISGLAQSRACFIVDCVMGLEDHAA